jgi:hypothetical protein
MRAGIAALSVALLIPTLVVSYWLANLSAASEQARIEQDILQEAVEVSTFIDRELAGVRNTLTALASSPFLQTGDLAAFHQQASQLAKELDVQIALRDTRAGQQIVNTDAAWGTSLGRATPPALDEADRQALASGRPVVSNVFWGPISGRYSRSAFRPRISQRSSNTSRPITPWRWLIETASSSPAPIAMMNRSENRSDPPLRISASDRRAASSGDTASRARPSVGATSAQR